MNVVELSAAARDDWRRAGGSVVETYLKRAGPLGHRLVEAVRASR